jgi:hypothetical protein
VLPVSAAAFFDFLVSLAIIISGLALRFVNRAMI